MPQSCQQSRQPASTQHLEHLGLTGATLDNYRSGKTLANGVVISQVEFVLDVVQMS